MAAVLALLAAAVYGIADFLGGFVVRRASTLGAVIVSQGAGLAAVLLITPALPVSDVTQGDLVWGAIAGLAGGVGVALLYRALAIGPMSLVAPVTAVLAAAIPVVAGLASGERPGATVAAGIVLALVAVTLIARGEAGEATPAAQGPTRSSRALILSIASGVAIGAFLVALERTGAQAGLWPLAAARVVSVGMFVAVALGTRRPVGVPRPVVGLAIACGALDMLANALYLWAVRRGDLSVVATLASLYPASTVLLARVALGERLSPVRLVGVACALVAVALIVGGMRV